MSGLLEGVRKRRRLNKEEGGEEWNLIWKRRSGRKESRESERAGGQKGEKRSEEKEGTDGFVLTRKVRAAEVRTEREDMRRGEGRSSLEGSDAWENPEEPPGRLPPTVGEFLHPTACCHGNATHTLAVSQMWRLDVSPERLNVSLERLDDEERTAVIWQHPPTLYMQQHNNNGKVKSVVL